MIVFSNAFEIHRYGHRCPSRRAKKLNAAERNDRNFEIFHRRQPRFPIQQVFKIQLSIYRSSSRRITRRRRRAPQPGNLFPKGTFLSYSDGDKASVNVSRTRRKSSETRRLVQTGPNQLSPRGKGELTKLLLLTNEF